eukprot:TRINITY_DN16991_c0_g2_i1.p1 TRINITY_DN16991_c0_g2~~TRINITY_DN16991_c0_g2_i1.p1  ORF type:complete len:613 (+),score=184.34 TRINITY_DN16991_c0_g2_i1:54-1892(+)
MLRQLTNTGRKYARSATTAKKLKTVKRKKRKALEKPAIELNMESDETATHKTMPQEEPIDEDISMVREVEDIIAHNVDEQAQEYTPEVAPVDPELFPSLIPKHPAYPSTLSLHENGVEQRENLKHLFRSAEIDHTWRDFSLLNHLSESEWSLESDRFNFLGATICKSVVSKSFLKLTLDSGLGWVRHAPPVTFTINKNDLYARSPNGGTAHGLPHFDASEEGHEPDVSGMLSYNHAKQVEAVLLNNGNLNLLALDHGMLSLQNSSHLPALQEFTPAEMQNPTLIMQPRQLISKTPNLWNTNLEPTNKEIGQKIISLIGAVKLEKGTAKAKDVARVVLGIDTKRDVLEQCLASLDKQVMETSPGAVVQGIYEYLNVTVAWRTDTEERALDERDVADYEMSLEEQDRIAASTVKEAKLMEEKSKEIQQVNAALKESRQPRENDEKMEKAEQPELHPDTSPIPAAEPEPSYLTEQEEEDEYTLQFDAQGNPIDIRETSLKYPIEPGPYQSDVPISEAPMYRVPQPDAPILERVRWKNMRRMEREQSKMVLEQMFKRLMTPRKLIHKSVMVDETSNKVLGYGVSECAITARVRAEMDALRNIKQNLMSLRTTVRDI